MAITKAAGKAAVELGQHFMKKFAKKGYTRMGFQVLRKAFTRSGYQKAFWFRPENKKIGWHTWKGS